VNHTVYKYVYNNIMYIDFLIGSGYRVQEKRGVGGGKGYLSICVAIAIADNAACSVDPIHLIDRLNVNIIIIICTPGDGRVVGAPVHWNRRLHYNILYTRAL